MDKITTDFNGIEVIWTKSMPLDKLTPEMSYTGFNPHEELLPKGWRQRPGRKSLDCDIIFTQDVAVEMRDGVKLYTDLLRPNKEGRFPAIVSWSPYGKNGSGFESKLDIDGVNMSELSGLQKFEACDPGYWCRYDYVMVNPDSRGCFMSEGNVHMWGTQDACDAYDMVEWIARQPWSNGKVAFAGNSWLAAAQWGVAAQQPPHLTAIAPWEGITDLFADDMCRGGIPDPAFNSLVVQRTPGNNYTQDTPAMVLRYPYRNAFWDDKVAAPEKITVPAYIVASYNSPAHTNGTIGAFNKIASKEKWLRIHNTGEWPDFYEAAHQEELRSFFDYYLKGVDNGWPQTPRVRISVINPGGADIVDRAEDEYPPSRQRLTRLHLASGSRLCSAPQSEEAVYSYNAGDKDAKLSFTCRFPQYTELCGYSKLRLWVEAEGAQDMDIYVDYDKLSAEGKPLIQGNIGKYRGPNGRLRVSCRALDETASTEAHPVLLQARERQMLAPGEIVAVDIPLWPTGLAFNAGESLRLSIAPSFVSPMGPPPGGDMDAKPSAPGEGGPAGDFPPIPSGALPRQQGIHKFHVGGQYDSYLCVPVVTE